MIDEFGYGLILAGVDESMVTLIGIEGLTGMHRAAQVALGGETKTKSTSTIESVTERKVDASSADVISKAVTRITGKDPAGTSIVGACLMWLSNHRAKNEDMKTLCTDMVRTSMRLPPVSGQALLKQMALKAAIERAAKCQEEIMKAKKGEFDKEKAAYCKKLDDEAKKL